MIKQTILNPEQIEAERASQASSVKEFVGRLANSMDLPSTLTEQIDEKEKNRLAPKEVESEEQQEEEEVETEDSDSEFGPDQEKAKDEDSLDEEEDLIPKSKVQKRFDEQTARIKRLELDLQKERETRESSSKKSDPQLEALEKMSVDELDTLKDQLEIEKMKVYKTDNFEELAKLRSLEKKVDSVIRTAPQKFQQTQISKFNQAVQETSESFEEFDTVKVDIFKQAKAIYDSSPELQGSVSGQERAWRFAVENFTAIKKASEGKSDNTELKRQVNTLKKKISVDSSSKKGVQQPDSEARLKRRAIHGSDADKAAFLRTRINTKSLVSDEELQSLENTRR